MTDTDAQIKNKIRKHAFSGGGATQEEHRSLGGKVEVDIAYQYLGFFVDDDEFMERLARVGYLFWLCPTLSDQCSWRACRVRCCAERTLGEHAGRREGVKESVVRYADTDSFTGIPSWYAEHRRNEGRMYQSHAKCRWRV